MLIGLHGHAGAGKDTVAQILGDHGYQRAAFADNVRAAALRLNPVVLVSGGRGVRLRTLVVAHGWDTLKRRVPEVRDLLDRMGSDVGRDLLGESVWIDLLFRELCPADTVITDVRAENEVAEIHRRGGVVVHVTRPGVTAPSNHPIHRTIDSRGVDYEMRNDATETDLRTKVEHLVWWTANRTA